MTSEGGGRPRDLAARGQPPPRPHTMADLRFRPMPAVRWFHPGVLARAGLRVVLSVAFGAYLDKRELQGAIPAEPLPDHLADRGELWLDYISDTGDGFDATYSVAWLASRPQLAVPGLDQPLPRGSVLVLGGDEVYPTAGPDEYENRFVGPYQAASPWLPEDQAPDMFVLPGNHDWYDGLTSFMRIFCQKKWVGAWRTSQSRSYFAVPLPHRWWLWGIDIQLDTYIDEPQLRYFERAVVERVKPGDRIILCTAKPSWVDTVDDPGAYRNLAYFERHIIRPAGAKLMLTLTGDSHHYSRYEEAKGGTHKITAGGGGAFCHPTHTLPPAVQLDVDGGDGGQVYSRTACYPEAEWSRRRALGASRLPLDNPWFMAVPAVVHVLLLLTSLSAIRALERFSHISLPRVLPDLGVGHLLLGPLRSPLSALVILLFLGALVGFAKPPGKWNRGRARTVAKLVMGLAHTALHVAAFLVVARVSIWLASGVLDGAGSVALLVALVAALGGPASGLAMGAYLAACNAIPGIGAHGNEAFSAQRITGAKNFVRLHVDGDGILNVYPIGLDRATTRWRPDGDAEERAPWLAPDGQEPEPHLIEGPILIDGR